MARTLNVDNIFTAGWSTSRPGDMKNGTGMRQFGATKPRAINHTPAPETLDAGGTKITKSGISVGTPSSGMHFSSDGSVTITDGRHRLIAAAQIAAMQSEAAEIIQSRNPDRPQTDIEAW